MADDIETQTARKKKRRGRPLLAAAAGIAAVGFSLTNCGTFSGVASDAGVDCLTDPANPACPHPDGGSGDGG